MAKAKSNELKTKERPVDFILVVTVLVMLSLGIVMVLSASSPSALSESGKPYTYVKTQAISAILGLILMYIISKIDYKKYKKFGKIAYICTIIALLLVLVPGLGRSSQGARRWIRIGTSMTFQPSEFAKIALVMFYASYLTNHREELGKFFGGFIKPLLYLLPILGILIGIQSHLSASVLIVLIVTVMMLMAGSKLRYFITFGSIRSYSEEEGYYIYLLSILILVHID